MATNPSVVFREPGRVAIEDREIPEPGPREVLAETVVSVVSPGTESTMLRGSFPGGSVWDTLIRYPVVPGYSGVARVIRTGGEVDGEWIGKMVACRAKHARFALHSPDSLIAVPDGVDLESAGFVTLAQIALNGLRRGDIRMGEAVVVFGAGIVGSLTALFCRIAGALPVFVVDVDDRRLERFPEDPLLPRVNPSQIDVVETVRRHTSDRMADAAFEATGRADLIAQEAGVLRDQGRLILVSSPREKSSVDLHDVCNRPSISIVGAHINSHPAEATGRDPWTRARHSELFMALLESGRLDLRRLIGRRIGYREAPELYKSLLAGTADGPGIVIRWDGN